MDLELDTIELETREDLVKFLKNTKYEFVILKFSAEWCKPCKIIAPFVNTIINEKIEYFDKNNIKNKFIYINVDVDECFDLYAFLKKKKMINGIPTIFLYSKKLYSNLPENEIFIPSASISGTNEQQIRNVLNFIK
uniref:Thioredoxin-2-Like Isoform X2 n=1 Tax=Florenciella sp. virus SA2 TaxID=3240092 RepID=A0AB39JFN2_9VIRU